MKRIGVLISGRGTNLQALIDAQYRGELGGEIVLVVSNKTAALGIKRAISAGIQVHIITKKQFPNRIDFDKHLIEVFRTAKVDLIVLAGYMRTLTTDFVDAFESRIINIHPSLLPAFKGINAQWQAVETGVRISGCSTHFVTPDVDSGPIILQKAVPVLDGDTGERLATRILLEEHRILVESVRLFCENRLIIENGRVTIKE